MWAVLGCRPGTSKSSIGSANAGIGDSVKPSIATLPTTAANTFALFIFSPPFQESSLYCAGIKQYTCQAYNILILLKCYVFETMESRRTVRKSVKRTQGKIAYYF